MMKCPICNCKVEKNQYDDFYFCNICIKEFNERGKEI